VRDCWRKCIARVTDTREHDVPDFVNQDPELWLANTGKWLMRKKGMEMVAMVAIRDGAGIDVLQFVDQLATPCICIIKTAKDNLHAVVIEGDTTVWDSEGEITEVEKAYGVYWIVATK
jgi:hypothetical protein